MKVLLDSEEWWPVMILVDNLKDGYGKPVEVSEEFFKQYKELMDRFDDLQVELRKL